MSYGFSISIFTYNTCEFQIYISPLRDYDQIHDCEFKFLGFSIFEIDTIKIALPPHSY